MMKIKFSKSLWINFHGLYILIKSMKIIRPITEYSINRSYLYDININETFIMNNNKYIVVLNKMLNCKDCSFNCRVECGSVKCAANERSDRKSVTFKKIP